MIRIALKGVWSHKVRLILSALAIILGVGLISGVYVYTDTIGRAFTQIFDNAYADIDIVVSGESDQLQAGPGGATGGFLDEAEVTSLEDIDEVATVYPSLVGLGVEVLDQEGEMLRSAFGPPTFSANLQVPDSDNLSQNDSWFTITEGDYPEGAGQIALDRATAELGSYTVGASIKLLSNLTGPLDATLVGIASYQDEDTFGGTSWIFFDLATVQEVLGRQGQVSGASLQLVGGAVAEDVIPVIEDRLSPGAVVLSGQSAAEAETANIQEGLSFFTVFLSAFGWIALFVGAFLIYNTFRIVVSQRSRELALLRALGADQRQVLGIVLLEAALIGTLGALVGLGFGLLIALGIQVGLPALGIELPGSTLTLLPRTVVVALGVGVVMTLVSALIPARRAAQVEVMEALRDDSAESPRVLTLRRVIVGLSILVLGLASLFAGLFADIDFGLSPIVLVGTGIAIVFIAVFVISPLFARPVAQALGRALATLSGIPGRLAQRNAQRSPDRTAATASAVMISITLVALAATLTASIRGAIQDVLANDVAADVTVQFANATDPTATFAPVVGERLADLEEVGDLARIQSSLARLRLDDPSEDSWIEGFIIGMDPDVTDFAAPESVEGTARLGVGEMMLDSPIAESLGARLGDVVLVDFPDTGETPLTLVGIVSGDAWAGTVGVSRIDWSAGFGGERDSAIYLKAAPGVSASELKEAVAIAISDFPNLAAFTREELQSQAEDQLNGLLNFILGLLALAVLIGMLGVTNTMALSVFERTREIGLLRAVGLDRRSTRWMVRIEASIVSLFGALLGIVLGVFFGWALIRSLSDFGLSTFVIPWLPTSFSASGVLGSLLFWMLATGLLGIVFAVYPARRAARLKVVEAIAHL